MSDNRKYYYLKLKENYFDDDSIVLLESMQDGVLYSNILLKLYLVLRNYKKPQVRYHTNNQTYYCVFLQIDLHSEDQMLLHPTKNFLEIVSFKSLLFFLIS